MAFDFAQAERRWFRFKTGVMTLRLINSYAVRPERSRNTMYSARGMSLDVARDERIKVKSSNSRVAEQKFAPFLTPVMLNLFQHPLLHTGDRFCGTMDPETSSG